MGRRPLGRKYAKHISIQVNKEHNEDLKYLASKLNGESPLPNGKKWTIRDIILTLLYTQHDNSSDWYLNNHFEQITETKLIDIRTKIRSDNDIYEKSTVQKEAKSNPVIPKTKAIKKVPISKSSLQVKINSDYQSYINQIRSIQKEENY